MKQIMLVLLAMVLGLLASGCLNASQNWTRTDGNPIDEKQFKTAYYGFSGCESKARLAVSHRYFGVKAFLPPDYINKVKLLEQNLLEECMATKGYKIVGTRPEKPITSAPTIFSSGTTRIVTWDFSDVKSAPGSKYSLIATVREGDKLTVLEQSGEWVRVRLENGQEGWIRGEVFE